MKLNRLNNQRCTLTIISSNCASLMSIGNLLIGAMFALILVFPGTGLGQGLFENAVKGSSEKTNPEQGSNDVLDLGGYIRGALFLGKIDGKDATEIKSGYGELALTLKAKLGSSGRGFAELRSRYGFNGGETRLENDLREAYVDLFLGPLDLRLGHQIITWGRADGINPTDNLTPKDMSFRSADEDDMRAANLAIRSTLNLGPTRTEIVWVPFFSPSRYPDFKIPGPVEFKDPVYPDKHFEHGTIASRFNLELPEIEASVSYLFGYSPMPGLELSKLNMSPTSPSVDVAFRAYQYHVAGFDFSSTPGGFLGIRGEAALKWPKDYDSKNYAPLPDVQYVLGMDKDFSDLYIIVQYIGKAVLDYDMPEDTGLMDLAQGKKIPSEKLAKIITDPEGAAQKEIRRKVLTLAGQTKEYQHSVMLRIQYKMLQETLKLEVSGMYNFSTGEYMVRPKISYQVADGLDAVIGGEVFGGPDNTLFGMIDQTMSAAFIEVRAWF
ncbi:MAG: hypothetical protein GXP49_01835 [Deltaproteobacteria bacterium]|nr:hypothetical protein [Deltaproteobacteria bacterium]